MSMRANGLLRKSGTLPWHAPVARSRVTLPWHAPVARSRGTLPWHAPPARAHARAPAGTTCHQARNPNGKHIYQRATVKYLNINILGKNIV